MTKNSKFDNLSNKAIEALEEFLDSDDSGKEALGRARVAGSILSAWTRHRQTLGARDATSFMLARELAEDREELLKYVALAMPENLLVKQLSD